MELLIRLEHEEPPAGTVVPMPESDRQPPALPFVGWLGLLRALAKAMSDETPSAEG